MESVAQVLLLPAMAYAAGGLALSLVAHVSALLGIPLGGSALFTGLHVGIFPLWLLVVLVMQRLTQGTRMTVGYGWNYWSVALSGCPAWMRTMTYGFFAYALANFVVLFVTSVMEKHASGAPPPSVWRGFSGHWMAFYSAGLAVLTSAYNRGLTSLAPRCRNGHIVADDDAFCSTCGLPLANRKT